MSRINLSKVAQPSTPAASTAELYIDTVDRRAKTIDENGVVSTLTDDGLKSRNVITNGGFWVQQRVATASTAIPSVSTTTRAGQVADRWAVTTGNATTTLWAQIDTSGAVESGLESRYYGRITQATNAAKFTLSQVVINSDMAHLRGKKVRVSCKLKQFVGSNQTYKLGLLQLAAAGTVDTMPAFTSAIGADGVAPTWGTNLAAITPDASPTAETGTINGSYVDCTSTASWVKYSAVFTIPSDAKNLVLVLWKSAAGGATDSVGVAEFQITSGPGIVDYVEPPVTDTLLRCQQFFYKTFSYATVPVTNAGVSTGCVKWSAGVAGAVAGTWSHHAFAVPMWKIPTITLFNPAAANAQVRQIGATAGDCTVSSGAEITTRGTAFTTTPGASAVVGTILGVHFTAEADFIT